LATDRTLATCEALGLVLRATFFGVPFQADDGF
jgi:hypothetical protein